MALLTENEVRQAARGTRDRPIHVTSHDDMFEAVQRVGVSTPAQRRAGNYPAAHVVVGGLPITIETPMGHVRSGTDPKGERWSVRMTAEYGYVKRTEGADGDHVDVYLGPCAHGVESCPVWVVDQRDADTHAFDEHKIMLGFSDAAHARHAYTAAFSDGRGSERVGAVTRMTFDEFVAWLDSGETKSPLAMRKSASVNHVPTSYGASSYSRGGHALTTPAGEKAASDPKTLGIFSRLFGNAVKSMSLDDRKAFMADATLLVNESLGKAKNINEAGYESVGTIEDLWDGPADDHLETVRVHGPGSSVPSGKVGVGPSQEASGNGAEKMEREYSRHAPQSGVQSATERLGRDIAGIKGKMASIIQAVEGTGMQIEALKATAASFPAEVDLKEMIAKAVTEALAEVLAPVTKSIGRIERDLITVKAEKESPFEKEDEKDDEADEAETAKAIEAETAKAVEVEIEDDDDDKKDESAKAAALLRLMAKSRIRFAGRRLRKAVEMIAEDKPKAAALAIAKATGNIAKAVSYVDQSKALRKSVGPSTEGILTSIEKAKEKLGETRSENQDKWPASDDKKVGKSATVDGSTVAEQGTTSTDLAKAVEQITLAAKGMGMMNATMTEVFGALSGQNRSVTDDGQVLPPVFALAKSSATDQAIREAELSTLLENGAINNVDFDRAHDVISHARMGFPPNVVAAAFDKLPSVVQTVLQPLKKAA